MTYKTEYLKIEIRDGGAAMENRAGETARILHKLADDIEFYDRWPGGKILFDMNGNGIGNADTKTRRV